MVKNIHTRLYPTAWHFISVWNNSIRNRRFNYPTVKVVFVFFLFFCLTPSSLFAQNDLSIQDVVVGKVEVSAPGSVTLKPGFHATAGSNFHAFIGPSTGSNISTTISSPTGNATPAAGSTDNNYIKSITYREVQTSVPTSSFKHLEDIQYFDGLGRPSQAVHVGASPMGNDIIQPILYDAYGREAIKTLPYTDTKSGTFRTGITETTVSNYYNSGNLVGKIADNRAYTEIGFENSPLNRVVSQTGPGADWATNSNFIHINYLTNDAKTSWSVNSDGTFTSFSYATGTLFVTETIDEQGNTTREYKDKQSQVVFKESKLDNTWLTTVYIYDDLGLLRCVVPPQASSPSDNQLCYYYTYDSRNRMSEKKIPGGGTITMVYDNRDRLRFTQDSKEAAANEWTFTKYDELNRPVITGIFTYTLGASALETATNAATLSESRDNSQSSGYNNASYPASGASVLTVTYYDDYDFFNIAGIGIGDSLKSVTYDKNGYVMQSNLAPTNKGRVTGSMTMVLSDATDATAVTKNKLYTTMWYDKYGHVLRTISENHLGGKDVVSNLYEDITYQVAQSKQEHFKGSEHITLEKWFEYDHTGRLLATREQVNDQPAITMNAMNYNEEGEMTTKYLHSAQTSGSRSFVQKEDYQYNIRGWLTQINDPDLSSDNDLFGMQLFYNSTGGMGSLAPGQGLYNGNIAGIKWNTRNDAVRGYQFSYDGLNRLLQANYGQGAALDASHDYFTETITGYDKNGNIQGLQRKYNNITVDNLTYAYQTKSNQLQRITDDGTASSEVDDYPGNSQDYGYDVNGNMNFDGAKNLNIDYQRTLNLPQSLDFGGNNRIFYHYTATGAKLIKHTKPANGTDGYTHYIGNIVYEGGKLSYIITDEGRLVPTGDGSDRRFLYEYSLKDHLGNNRVSFMGTDLGGAVDVVQTTNYYPFGLVMNQANGNTAPGYQKNKYLYNGKELQDDKMTSEALEWYDYGARMYDPQIARFHTQDPSADSYEDISPYAYVKNNPLSSIDPSGMDVVAIDGGYRITGDDIYNYWGYLTEMGTGGYSQDQQKNMYSNLVTGLDAASKENEGSGGPMESTLGEIGVEGKGIAGYDKTSSKNYSLYTAEENEAACKFMLFAAGGEIAGAFIGIGAEAYETYRATRAGAQIFKSLGAAAEGFSLTNKAKKILGNLVDLSNLTLREGVKLRGGKTGNLNVIGEWLHDLPIGEVANKAAEGNSEALTAIKILKQAAQKSQKY